MIELKVPDLIKETSANTGANSQSVKAVLELTEEGCTIPFIARYRKEMTGGLDEVMIASVIDTAQKIEALDKRKRAVLKSLVETENYTDELGRMVDNAVDMATLEDIYAPYKPGRKTKADKAIEAGLLPLADWIIERKRYVSEIESKAVPFICENFNGVEEVISGVKDIVAQKIADDVKVRSFLRVNFKKGFVFSKVKRGKKEEAVLYGDYFDYSEPVAKIPPHRVMAMLRAEKEGFLNVSVVSKNTIEQLADLTASMFFRENCEFYLECASQALEKLLQNSIETEVINELKDIAIEASLEYFHKNLEQIISAPPFGEKAVIGIDPGIRTGCKAVVLDNYGNYVESTVINLHADRSQALKIKSWIEKYKVKAIAVGSGTFGRESLEILRSYYGTDIIVASVSEDGASIYSASEIARSEFPDLDLTVRGAISIGRRFQDPLSELVKIAPESLGIGQYQHDIPGKMLAEKLKRTVEWVVNRVGANLNTASPYLLSYISGLDSKKSAQIFELRKSNGRFNKIDELK
ncbi:MAG TPA: Tex-like N-terminal domain-containing protein, partial [bacterium]|nr:Tex-like N-terminal domain-containing protein [bacterium]